MCVFAFKIRSVYIVPDVEGTYDFIDKDKVRFTVKQHRIPIQFQ